MSFVKSIFFLLALLACFQSAFSQSTVLRGNIIDERGETVPNAKVSISSNRGKISFCDAGAPGKFSCEIALSGNFTLTIEAEGFSILRQTIANTQDFSAELNFSLQTATLREQVVVTGNRMETRLGETPASVMTVSRAEISASAAPVLDDTLRQVAGFSIFRRSSSRTANPTAQGVSLRGVGASGASRSLVIFDGVPLNDPFGGWVQWNRVSPIGVERVEVLRGGASSLYGNSSLSGAVNIIPRAGSEKFTFSAEAFGGSQKTMSGSAFAGFRQKAWSADLTASSFQTKGYIPVDELARGPADVFAGVRSTNFSGRVIGRCAAGSVFVRPSFFGEVRTNGTGLQTNRTHIRQVAAGGEIQPKRARFEWQLYGGAQVYDQVFSAVNAARTNEALNRIQRVPAQNIGLSTKFSTSIKDHSLLFGFETRGVRGASDETVYANGLATSLVGAGGRERTLSFFGQDFIKIGKKLVIAGSVRYDEWRNSKGLTSTRTLSSGQTTTVIFPDRSESALSPQLSFLYRANARVSFQAQVSRSFRAPTLNELYRNFRVGNVLTLANENLLAEKADNFEAGVSYNKKSTYLRGTFFRTEIDKPVSNITIATTPVLITRQRRNAGRTRSAGFEIEAETRIERLRLSFGYLMTDSQVISFPSDLALEGRAVPQVARHQVTFQARYPLKDWTLALQGRASSKQFDDDLNLFRLEPYLQLDLFASRRLRENLSIFTGIENLLNSRYSIGKTPVRTVSSPLNVRAGFRWK